MNAAAVLQSAAILGGVGLTFGVLIALAHRSFRVWEDPRIATVNDVLPGANCGACGYAGCRAFAEAVVTGGEVPAGCTVMSEVEREEVADLLGVDAGEANRRVARLLCAGGSDVATQKADYFGVGSCAAAAAVSGGGKGCSWGCIGLGDCAVSCDFGAIVMSDNDLPVVDAEKCTACNDCVVACPLDLFVLLPVDAPLLVQCRSLLEGEAATDLCSVACNACGRCAADAPDDLVVMRDGIAVVDYEKISLANPSVVERCPTDAIVWLEGEAQFPGLLELALGQAAGPTEGAAMAGAEKVNA